MQQVAVTLYFDTLAIASAYISKLPALPTGATATAPAPAAAAPAAPAAAAAPAGLTLEQMQGKLKALMDAKGKDVVVKIFGEMSAKKLSDIKPDQYPILDAKIAAALAAETPLF